ncbi:MAG: hypothetical protein B7Z31_11310 [Rhodobacterales bacterium 12-65-15]|nr:MAG: hypothetical protein B7Z31_11310 [Rhodobacterales bacterium 12-65-15]
MIRVLVTAFALATGSIASGQELSPNDFQSRTEGRAFGTYFPDGRLLGIEIFLPGRQVIWQAADGTCQKGIWQVQNGYVCYLYEGFNPGHCMRYRAEGDTMVGTTDTRETFILRQGSEDDVTCPTDEPLLSMDTDRGVVILAREVEGEVAVGDQRQLLAIGAVD